MEPRPSCRKTSTGLPFASRPTHSYASERPAACTWGMAAILPLRHNAPAGGFTQGGAMLKHVVLLAALFVFGAVSAQPYPAKPLRFIVPDGPGSVSDLRARQLAVKLSEQLGQSVVIDNRPGGSFIVGAEAAAKAPADGYTIFLGSIVTHALNPLLFKT